MVSRFEIIQLFIFCLLDLFSRFLIRSHVFCFCFVRYGGGPTLARRVISSGLSQTELAVEVYPLRLQLLLMPKNDQSAIRISKKVTPLPIFICSVALHSPLL